jgi:hypothetical protein
VVNGKSEDKDWSATRMTKNAQSKQGVENPTSADIRCYSSQTASNVVTVPAGATVNYVSTQQINHPGPTQYYLAKVPSGSSAKSFDGSGAVWFKIATTMPTTDNNKQLVWPGQSMARQLSISAYDEQSLTTINTDTYETTKATIPANTPDGEYILRVEQIALHMASQPNKAQFYLACSQIQITGGGNGTPGPLVSLPGAYSSNDPGILVNIYSIQPDSYKPPGPAVWSG